MVSRITGMRDIEKIKFSDLKELALTEEWLYEPVTKEKFRIHCCCEKVVDQREKQDFVPFVTMKLSEADLDKVNDLDEVPPSQVMFNVLSVNKLEVTCSVPCTVPECSLADLSASKIRISKCSSL